jgi:hypothetical protein
MLKHPLYLLFLSLAFLCSGLQANSLIVGQPPKLNTGDCDPFGCPGFFGLTTYQQVYVSSQFPTGPIDIQALTFFDVQVQNSGTVAGGLYTLSLSYTSNAPGALSITNPSDNVATDFQTFFVGNLPSLVDIGNGGRQMTINGAPFTYNPADGNLLLTVTVANPLDEATWAYFDQAAQLAQTTNAYFGLFNGAPISGGNTVGGLITQFSYSPATAPVPEPASLLIVFGGIAALGCYRWMRANS